MVHLQSTITQDASNVLHVLILGEKACMWSDTCKAAKINVKHENSH